MNKIKLAIITLVSILLTSCSSIYRSPLPSEDYIGTGHRVEDISLLENNGNKPLIDDKKAYLLEYKLLDDKKSLPQNYKDAASNYFIYSLMSSNAYIELNDVQYKIPDWKRIDRWDSNKGLGFDVYIKKETKQLVIAFRGTEESGFKDWWYANIAIFGDGQYEQAYQSVKTLKKLYNDYTITTTGHSLGGALAINISLRIKGIDAIAFNSSPRFFFGETKKQNKQTLLSENKEILKTARWFWNTDDKISEYNMTNFENFNFIHSKNPIKQHSMYKFSRGLLLVALANTDNQVRAQQAQKIFQVNFSKSEATRAISSSKADKKTNK